MYFMPTRMHVFGLIILCSIDFVRTTEATEAPKKFNQRNYGSGYMGYTYPFIGRFGGSANGFVFPSPYGSSVGTFPIILPRQVRCADGSAPLEPIRCTHPADRACPAHYSCQLDLQACCRKNSQIRLPIIPRVSGACPDGSSSQGLGCVSSAQCTTGNYCPTSVGKCCKLGLPSATVVPPRMCPDGTAPIPQPSTCTADNDCSFSQYFCSRSARACCLRPNIVANRTCPGGSIALAQPPFCDSNVECPQPNFSCSPSINACCPGQGIPETSVTVKVVCPDGTAATVISCDNDAHCGETQYCWRNVGRCCTRPSGTCPDGSPPVLDPPVCMPGLDQCGAAATCTGGVCCPIIQKESSCPNGGQPIGACVRGLCAVGFSCFSPGLCCASAPTGDCASGAQPVGGCLDGGQCGAGFVCERGNICCPPNRLFRPPRITKGTTYT